MVVLKSKNMFSITREDEDVVGSVPVEQQVSNIEGSEVLDNTELVTAENEVNQDLEKLDAVVDTGQEIVELKEKNEEKLQTSPQEITQADVIATEKDMSYLIGKLHGLGMNLQPNKFVNVGLEAANAAPIQAFEIQQEGIGQTIKEFFQKIWDFIKGIFSKIFGWFKKILPFTKKKEEAIKTITKTTKDTKDTNDDESKKMFITERSNVPFTVRSMLISLNTIDPDIIANVSNRLFAITMQYYERFKKDDMIYHQPPKPTAFEANIFTMGDAEKPEELCLIDGKLTEERKGVDEVAEFEVARLTRAGGIAKDISPLIIEKLSVKTNLPNWTDEEFTKSVYNPTKIKEAEMLAHKESFTKHIESLQKNLEKLDKEFEKILGGRGVEALTKKINKIDDDDKDKDKKMSYLSRVKTMQELTTFTIRSCNFSIKVITDTVDTYYRYIKLVNNKSN